MDITPEMRQQVATLLGRQPRGLEDIPVSRADGTPMVIRVSSLVDDKPFPTMYWLIDRELCYRIDQLEAAGTIKQLQAQVDQDPLLQQAMREDNQRYIAAREQLMSQSVRQRLATLGFSEVLANKGIGGIADFTRIRCLHTWYGAHLVEANAIGKLLDLRWREEPD